MRAVPTVLALLLLPALLAPLAEAAAPRALAFNGQASADVKGPVRAVSVDGPGFRGFVAVGDEPTNLQDVDLAAFNLGGGNSWQAADLDIVNEGARLVAVANGTSGGEGQWVALVNNTVPSILSMYQASGASPGGNLGRAAWQFNPDSGPINSVDISGSGDIVAMATGAAAQNRTLLLLRNKFLADTPKVLFRATAATAEINDVVQFNAVAISTNSTVPAVSDSTRAIYTIAGTRTTTTSGIAGGSVYVFETTFASGPDNSVTRQVLRFDTSTPVVRVDMTSDGEYAVAGTEGGQVYLVSVQEALVRRGIQGIDTGLLPFQQNIGGGVKGLAIARAGGEFFAAGADNGDIVLFRNERNPSRSSGAQAVQVASANVNTPGCGPTRLSGSVASLALSQFGDQLVVGAQNGLLAFEAAAYARFRPGAFEPAWCIPFAAGDVRDGVFVDLNGNGRLVFSGTGHRVFGYENFYCLKADAQNGPSRGGAPGSRVQWALTIRNDGSFFDRINLTASGPLDPGWEVALSNSSLFLMPGKSQVVLLNVTSPQTVAPGNFSINVQLTAEKGHGATGTQRCQGNQNALDLRLNLGQLRAVELRPPTGILVAQAGSSNTFPITVHNGGNAADRFRVTARIPEPEQVNKSPGSDWVLRMDPAEIEIPAQSDGTVNLVVTPSAQRGDFANVELTVEPAVPSAEGFVGDTKGVTVAVEPSFNGDIALVETRDYTAYPGQQIFINYTVKNLGNSRDTFIVKNRTEPVNAPGFRLTLSDERFELRTQNAQKVVRLTAFVQAGVQPGEQVRIIVDLFSVGVQRENPGNDGQVDSQPVTLNIVVQPRRGLPLAPEPLVLLGILGLAVALRRRED